MGQEIPGQVNPGAVPRKRRLLNKLIPVNIVLFMAVLVARDKSPQVRAWIEKIVQPDRWRSVQACQRAALAAAQDPAYARVINPGTAHDITQGYYVEGIRVGEMGANGREVPFAYNCYADESSGIVRSGRQ
jgi:hypothetical protein